MKKNFLLLLFLHSIFLAPLKAQTIPVQTQELSFEQALLQLNQFSPALVRHRRNTKAKKLRQNL